MDVFESRYYKINKVFLCVVGQWPFARSAINFAILFIIVSITGTQFAAKICGLITTLDDTDLMFESLPPMIVDIACGIKILNFTIMKKKMIELLRRIRRNCYSINSILEIELSYKYAEKSRRFTQIYAGILYSCVVLYILLPFLPIITGNRNNITEKPLLHNVEYFVDTERYYYPILMHANTTIVLLVTVLIAMDSIFNVFVQHACGLFAILRYRLETVMEYENLEYDLYPALKDDLPYKRIIKGIEMHKTAIEFVDLLESAYSSSFLLEGGLNILGLSVTGLQAATNVNNPNELIRQLALQFAILFRLFLENYHGQLITDNSARVQQSLINVKWYQMSMRSRRLLSIMIMRACTPSELTAGKLYPISVETYSTIVRTSMSYFTLLQSIQ